MVGWISLHRKIWDHWLIEKNRPLTKFEAWLKILSEVNVKPAKVMIGNELITVERGQSINSLDTWAKLFRWEKSKVRRFIKMLETDSMIVRKPTRKTTHLSVCNYDNYQCQRHSNDTQMTRKRHSNDTQMTPNNKDNKDNKDNKGLKKSKYKYYDHIINFFPSKNYKEKEWLSCYDKLINIDGYTEKNIFDIVKEFRSNDNWWHNTGNFESILKLRRKNKEGIKYIDYFYTILKKKKFINEKSKINLEKILEKKIIR